MEALKRKISEAWRNKMDFDSIYKSYLSKVTEGLEKFLPLMDGNTEKIYSAMRYSLFAGGKRIRPVLTLAVADTLGADVEDALPFACALEMIHTYSLIHDDLPAMDNDDLRRGRPTNHKVFGEGMAILVGDGLLNKAFEIMTKAALKTGGDTNTKIRAMDRVATGAGVLGMIGGQVIDIEFEGKSITEETLRQMHAMKTGALLKASVLAGAEVAFADENTILALSGYADAIGLAFQICDDILDVEGSTEKLGKPCGSDVVNNKSTFVTFYGLDGAKEKLEKVTNDAVCSLDRLDCECSFLKELAIRLSRRES